MWLFCFLVSAVSFFSTAIFALVISNVAKKKYNVFNMLFASTAIAAFFMFVPIHTINLELSVWGIFRAIMLSVFNAIQLFPAGCDYSIVAENITNCPDVIKSFYQAWMSGLFVMAPLFTFGFVLSLFKNVFANIRYVYAYFRDVYVFSELNEKSFALANDIKNKNKKATIVFTDVFDDDEEKMYELIERTKEIGAINFKKDILVVDFSKHSKNKELYLFTIGENETENMNQALKLIDNYKMRQNTHLYVFSTKIESELLLSTVDKGFIKVRRINEVQSLVNRILYEEGDLLFKSATTITDAEKEISVIIVGMGSHGTELVKALTWYGQMDGYKIEINAFDVDPLAEEKFVALAPELMHKDYNGVSVKGEAEYKITIHPNVDVNTQSFVDAINKVTNATFVIVALGDDDVNINTAVNLRMHFERMGIHPTIQAIVYNTQQKNALAGIKNYRGQEYDIGFIGDIDSSYTEDVIIDSELEDLALERHLKWGNEEEFWAFEYNYRSSVASAIHLKARINCGIPGASKKEEDLTMEERDIIENLEHRRWNAYMRAEGYVYSGSKDKSSRNDLGKMHHDLIDFSSLSEEEKRKDSRVGTN